MLTRTKNQALLLDPLCRKPTTNACSTSPCIREVHGFQQWSAHAALNSALKTQFYHSCYVLQYFPWPLGLLVISMCDICLDVSQIPRNLEGGVRCFAS